MINDLMHMCHITRLHVHDLVECAQQKHILALWIRISENLPWDRKSFLAYRIRISEILPWDRKYYLTRLSYPSCHIRASYIGCIGTRAHGWSSSDVIVMFK